MSDGKPNAYEQLFNLFVDEAREKQNINAAASLYLNDLCNLIANDLRPLDAAGFRGFSIAPGKGGDSEPDAKYLLVVRAETLQGGRIVSFANGSTLGLTFFNWLHRAATEGINWKPDEPSQRRNSPASLLDVISGNKSSG